MREKETGDGSIMKKVSQYSLCKHDIYLAGALAAAAVLLLVLLLFLRGGAQGNVVVIMVQGREYGTYPLNEDREILIDTELGHNKLHITGGTVLMEEADCPDKYCISKGGITRNKDSIVCLPHRVVAEIRFQDTAGNSTINGSGEIDAISQ